MKSGHLVAAGTTIAVRLPHRTVRARLCIRLQPRMSSGEAFHRIWMQDTGYRSPARKDRCEAIPRHHAALTAATQDEPPQSTQALSEDTLRPFWLPSNSADSFIRYLASSPV